MFDFTNYTYSGLLAILATLFALSYPLIISSIERIDSKYNSTLLTARFRKESVFQWFQGLLILNVGITISLPFFMNGCSSTVWIIVMQAIALITVISLVLKLYSLILDYYDPAKLKDKILRDYSNAQKKGKKKREKRYFAQWTELTDTLLKSGDFSLEKSVYDTLGKYRQNFWKKINEQKSDQKDKEKPYDEYFYQAVSKINETLCKNKRQPSTSLSILTYLFPYNNLITFENLFPKDLNIPYTSFRAIWNNIQIQLFYDRDDFILQYWEEATSKGAAFYQEENKKKEEEVFLEFHIMLATLVLRQKKYPLLKRILSFSQTGGRSYPLIPSKLSAILVNCEKLYRKIQPEDSFYIETQYPLFFPKEYGTSEKLTIKDLFFYFALLVYRLYKIVWYNGESDIFNTSNLPDQQDNLSLWKGTLQRLSQYVDEVRLDKELLAVIGISDFEKRLNELNEAQKRLKRGSIRTPQEILIELQREPDEVDT